MVVNLADIVRRTNALSEIIFHPQDLIRQPLRVQNALLRFKIFVTENGARRVELVGPREGDAVQTRSPRSPARRVGDEAAKAPDPPSLAY